MKTRSLLLAMGMGLLAAAPLCASPIVFSFGGPNVALGPSVTFTAGGLNVTASGFVGTAANDLYEKNTGASENGLGLNGTTDFEINPEQAIVFDVSDLISHGFTQGTFTLGSLQSGELAKACIQDSSHITTSCVGGTAGNGSSLGSSLITWGSDPFVRFTVDGSQTVADGNFLVETLSVPVTTPEPATWLLLATGLGGLLWAGRRLAIVS